MSNEDLFHETENPAPETAIKKIDTITEMVINGEINPLRAMILLNQLEKRAVDCKEKIKDMAIREAEKHGAKTFEFEGAKITINEGRAMYDFKHITEWNTAHQKLKHIEELAKHSLQATKKGLHAVELDGEVVTSAVETFARKSITITLQK